MTTVFQKTTTLDERILLSQRVMNKYPDRKPVIIEKMTNSKLPDLPQKKYLLPDEMQFSQVAVIIRKNIKLEPNEALFIMVNNHLVSNSRIISEIYNEYSNKDDSLLYIMYTTENTFGSI
jgi:GABA(A) receptor-associated protein